MTQPLDVLKTRSMNAKPGEFSSAMHLIKYTAQSGGPMAFYKVRIFLLPSGILRDKTMIDKLMYIPNDDTQMQIN